MRSDVFSSVIFFWVWDQLVLLAHTEVSVEHTGSILWAVTSASEEIVASFFGVELCRLRGRLVYVSKSCNPKRRSEVPVLKLPVCDETYGGLEKGRFLVLATQYHFLPERKTERLERSVPSHHSISHLWRQSHVATDDQSVIVSWCRAPTRYCLVFDSYGTQNYFVFFCFFFTFSPSGILETRKHDVSETRPQVRGKTPTQLGASERANLNHWRLALSEVSPFGLHAAFYAASMNEWIGYLAMLSELQRLRPSSE
jgi:hypothetical protein